MKFDPAKYNKLWAALVTTFASQWGIDTNQTIDQIMLTPPENMMQAFAGCAVVGAAVWYFKNKGAKDE